MAAEQREPEQIDNPFRDALLRRAHWGRAFESCRQPMTSCMPCKRSPSLSYGPLDLPRGLGGAGQKP
jgi:hypothetical protein